MKRPGMVFIDEVQNYLHLPTPIDDVLATSRSYGVAWHLAHQYRKQLPDKLRSALDVNARSKICFALDPDDARGSSPGAWCIGGRVIPRVVVRL